ncbi:DapH/DapD/GlmU-related protein [Azospirillum tabaci]|uniref:DapH/DapD/GlmU-related protein n=1 Tax=Azospirillum tabaci TaxID=2752310 RepID=UPI001661331B|nr:DapH/DapD/GlmU-related protein [Azospirillum tabaci]
MPRGCIALISSSHGEEASAIAAALTDLAALASPGPDACADPDVRGIVIVTPPATGANLARHALAAGKHVMMEASAVSTGTLEALAREADARGLFLCVWNRWAYAPAFLRLRALKAEGALGRLRHITALRPCGDGSDPWTACHEAIGAVMALVGRDPSTVQARVVTTASRMLPAAVTVLLDFPSGETAEVTATTLLNARDDLFAVAGDRRRAVLDWNAQPHRALRLFPMREDGDEDGAPAPVGPESAIHRACAHFLDVVRQGSRPLTDATDAMPVLRVMDAARAAGEGDRHARTGRITTIPGVSVHESAWVDAPAEIGEGTRIWHFTHVLAGARIGRNCNIGQNVMIGPGVTVGNGCKIQNNVSIYPGVELSDGVFCGPSCVFTNVINPRAEIERKTEFRTTFVGRGASIGANATIVCGVTLGAYSFIAAGAVVTRDVPPHALMAGVPARRIGWMSHAGHRLGPNLTCPSEGRRYMETGPDRLEEINR